jgi:ribose transport system permease protein
MLIAIGLLNPRGFDTAYYLALVKRAAPLAILAVGELFVIVGGEFDLSVGSIVTVVVVGAAVLTAGDPELTWIVITALFAIGLLVGLVNGLLTAKVGVPSFIVTLGMLLILDGGVALWTSGAPRGSLPQNLRMFGRESLQDVPILGQVPYAVFVILIVGAIAFILLHRTNFGKRVFAVGGNARAAALAGVNASRTKIATFVISATFAVIAGILLAGFGGLSNRAGATMEFAAISAVVLGGAVLGGGRGSVITAIAGAFTLEALFTVLNLIGLPVEVRSTVQGAIIIAAVAYASYRLRRG